MANLAFDLEEAELALQNIENLLVVFTDFFDKECPPQKEWSEYTNEMAALAANYANRSNVYYGVIFAALEATRRLREEMKKGIEKRFAEIKRDK